MLLLYLLQRFLRVLRLCLLAAIELRFYQNTNLPDTNSLLQGMYSIPHFKCYILNLNEHNMVVVIDCMFISPHQNYYVEILTPKVIVLGGRVFGRWSGHESRVLMIGISFFIKEALESSFTPSTMSVHGEKTSRKQAVTRHWTSRYLDIGLPSLQNSKK